VCLYMYPPIVFSVACVVSRKVRISSAQNLLFNVQITYLQNSTDWKTMEEMATAWRHDMGTTCSCVEKLRINLSLQLLNIAYVSFAVQAPFTKTRQEYNNSLGFLWYAELPTQTHQYQGWGRSWQTQWIISTPSLKLNTTVCDNAK
jgi:hypothetical protein